MAALDDEFEFVAASLERAATIQKGAFEEALARVGVRNPALLRHLLLAYDAVHSHVAERRKEYAAAPDDTVRRSAITELRNLTWSVRDMQTNLPWLDAVTESVLDFGTTFWLEKLARETVHPDAEVTVIATDHTSYATQTDPWEPLITSFGSGIPAGEPPVVVVHIPRRERHSGLLHPLIIHELGHAIDSEHHVVAAIWNKLAKRKPFQRRFITTISAYATSEQISQQDAAREIGGRLNAWITETYCDSVASARLGPTYLYSFLAEVAAGSIDDAGERHPPARTRIDLIWNQLQRVGWRSEMAAANPALDSWVDQERARAVNYTDVPQFLVWAVKYTNALVRSSAQKSIQVVLRPDAEGLDEAKKLLTGGIPPAQAASGAPISPEVIILACWFSALSASGDGPQALPRAADAPQLASLLPAALELSAVVGAWQSI